MSGHGNSDADELNASISDILKIKVLKYIILVAFVSAIILLIFYFYNFNGPLATKSDEWGQFGDFIGGSLNPLFGFLSLIAVLITILLQSKELRESNRALKDQHSALVIQSFNSMFFTMLEMNSKLIKSVEFSQAIMNVNAGKSVKTILENLAKKLHEEIIDIENTAVGNVEYDRQVYDFLSRLFQDLNVAEFVDVDGEIDFGKNDNRTIRKLISVNQRVYWKPYLVHLENYFRNIEVLILSTLSDKYGLDEDDTTTYLNILKFQLTQSEMFLFYYFLFSGRSNLDTLAYKKLIDFDFFSNVDIYKTHNYLKQGN